jgi:hypothetical protein
VPFPKDGKSICDSFRRIWEQHKAQQPHSTLVTLGRRSPLGFLLVVSGICWATIPTTFLTTCVSQQAAIEEGECRDASLDDGRIDAGSLGALRAGL